MAGKFVKTVNIILLTAAVLAVIASVGGMALASIPRVPVVALW